MAGNADENGDQESTGSDTSLRHETVLFDGTYPTPTANVSEQMHVIDRATQLAEATEYFDFITNPSSNLLELNSDDVIRTAIIGIPNSSLVKTLYSGGIGASGIGHTSSDDGNFLFLYGDGGPDIGAPSSMSLPASIREVKTIAVMTDEQCAAKLTEKGANFQWPLLPRDKVTTEESIMQIAPLPPYLLYDGISTDLNAALLYERILHEDTHGLPIFQHAKQFLRACLSRHNNPDVKPYVAHMTLLQVPSSDARKWANARFKSHFPSLVAPPPPST
jgi:hypothetical protein